MKNIEYIIDNDLLKKYRKTFNKPIHYIAIDYLKPSVLPEINSMMKNAIETNIPLIDEEIHVSCPDGEYF